MNLKRVAFHTLGCKLNFSETSTIARQFEEDGAFSRVTERENADIHIINSCSVTDNSDKKCRALIRRLIKQDPNSIIAITGCYAQLKAEEVANIEGVDLVVGNNNKAELFGLVSKLATKGKAEIYSCENSQITSFFQSFSSGDRTRSFLKVQDGCNYKCSYCTIPLARGESRNIAIETLIEEAKEIAAKGLKEIVITGVNTGDFGRTTGEKFIDLLSALDKVEGIERYRISSIEPNLLSGEILEFCKSSSKFQPHFHIPLQSGSDKILKLMRRRYTTSDFEDKIALARKVMGDIFVGIDVIVGFPGESDEEFAQTLELLKRVKPAYIHVFPYSERANTDAVNFEGKVSPETKHERVQILSDLCHELHSDYCSKYIGTKAKILVEGMLKGGGMHGYTENYIKVKIPFNKELKNQIIDVVVEEICL